MAKFLILTAVTGNWDDLTDPPTKFDDCDYIAFVDTPANVSVWEQRPAINFSTIDKFRNRRNAKIYKVLASTLFPQYEYIVWQDGNHHLVKHPQLIVDEYGSFDLLCFKHADRNCWYQEAMAVTKWRVELPENAVAQAEFYLRQEFPQESGLYELPTFIRRNSPIVREFEFMWWEQICKFASRDQISFPYVLWRLGDRLELKLMKGYANIDGLRGHTGGNEYFSDTGKHKTETPSAPSAPSGPNP